MNYLYLTCFFLLTFAWAGCAREQSNGLIQIDDSKLVTSQPTAERVIEGTLAELYPIKHVFPDSVAISPSKVERSKFGTIVLELPGRIAIFDSTDAFLRHIGSTVATGPWELQKPIDISWMASGRFAVADRMKKKLTEFDIDGSAYREVTLPHDFVSFGFFDADRYVSHHFTGSRLFSTLQTQEDQANEIESFGWFAATSHEMAGLPQGGRLKVIPGTDTFIFTPLNAGRIARYAWDGTLQFYIQTIDKQPYYDVVEGKGLSQENVHGIGNTIVSASDSLIYLFRFAIGDSSKPGAYIDKYAASNGSYVSSIELPEDQSCSPLHVDPENVWLNCSYTLVKQSKYSPEK